MGNRRRPNAPWLSMVRGHQTAPGLPAVQEGFWNGLPTVVRKVVVEVGEGQRPESVAPEHWRPWWRGLEGTQRNAVLVLLDGVNYGGGTVYLDDEDGSGWAKVTTGKGSPSFGHRELPVARVIGARR